MPSLAPDLDAAAPIFAGLTPPLAERLLARRHAATYDEGEILFQEGDPACRMFVLLDGTVKLVRTREDGSETLLGILERGDTIVECAYCARDRHSFSAEAVTRTRVLAIEAETVSALIAEEASFAATLMRLQRRHLDDAMDQLEQLKRMTAAQRVGAFVLRLTKQKSGPATVTLPHEKSLIAGLLGMNPESFSRALAKLRDIGMTVEGRSVRLVAVERLRRYCEPD